MTREFVGVSAGQQFAGGILTEAGAYEVNAGRVRTAYGKKESLNLRLARALREMQKSNLAVKLLKDDRKIYGI